MKKFLCVLLSVLLMFSCMSIVSIAAPEDEETIDINQLVKDRLMQNGFTNMLKDVSIPTQLSATGAAKPYDMQTLRANGTINNVNVLGLTVRDLYSTNRLAWTSESNTAINYPVASWNNMNVVTISDADASNNDIRITVDLGFAAPAGLSADALKKYNDTYKDGVHAKLGGLYLAKSADALTRLAATKSVYRTANEIPAVSNVGGTEKDTGLAFNIRDYGITRVSTGTTDANGAEVLEALYNPPAGDWTVTDGATYYFRFFISTDDGEYKSTIYKFTTEYYKDGTDEDPVIGIRVKNGSVSQVSGYNAESTMNGVAQHAAEGTIKVSQNDFAILYGEMNDYLRRIINSKFNDVKFYTAENATKLANMLGHLLDPDFVDVQISFSTLYVTADVFYRAICLFSGLTETLTAKWFLPRMTEEPKTNADGLYAYTAVMENDATPTIYFSSISLNDGCVIVANGTTYTIQSLLSEKDGVYTYSAVNGDGQKVRITCNASTARIGSTVTIDGTKYRIEEQQMVTVQATDVNGNLLYSPKLNFLSLLSTFQVNYRELEAPDAQINRPEDIATFTVRSIFENVYTIGPLRYLIETLQVWLVSHGTTNAQATEALFYKWIESGKITAAELNSYTGFLNMIANGCNPNDTEHLQFFDLPVYQLREAKSGAECFLALLLYLNLLGNHKGNSSVVAKYKNAVNNSRILTTAKAKSNIISFLEAMLDGEYDNFSTKITAVVQENIEEVPTTARFTFLTFLSKILKGFTNFFDKFFRMFDVFHLVIK